MSERSPAVDRGALANADALDAATACLLPALERLGADAGYVALRNDEQLEIARVTPFSERPVYLAVPLDAPYPLAVATRHAVPLFIESNDVLACDHPGLVRMKAVDHACATVPLAADEVGVLGAVNVTFEDPRTFAAEDRAILSETVARCAQALSDRVR